MFEKSLSTRSLILGGTDCQLGAKIKDKGNQYFTNCPTSKRRNIFEFEIFVKLFVFQMNLLLDPMSENFFKLSFIKKKQEHSLSISLTS